MNELELFHADIPDQCTAEQARDLTDRIKLVLDGMWELVKAAYASRAWAALGYATWDDYCTREFGTCRLKLPREERGEIIASLRESGLSARAIANVTGIGLGTVGRELANPTVPPGTVDQPSRITGLDGKGRPAGRQSPPAPPLASGSPALPCPIPSRPPVPVSQPSSSIPEPSMFDDEVLDGEIVRHDAHEQGSTWGQAVHEAAREAAEQIAEKVAEFTEQAEQDAQLNATPGMRAVNEQIRRERPYGLAAIDLEEAINGLPLQMDPRELAAHMPLTHRDAAERVPQALAWLSEFAQAIAEWRKEGAA